MTQLTFSAVCMIAALAVSPALAAPHDKPRDVRQQKKAECAVENHGQTRSDRRAKRQDEAMDCIVVKGYPSQDGRATLRRSLTEDARESLRKIELPSLRDLIRKKGPTS